MHQEETNKEILFSIVAISDYVMQIHSSYIKYKEKIITTNDALSSYVIGMSTALKKIKKLLNEQSNQETDQNDIDKEPFTEYLNLLDAKIKDLKKFEEIGKFGLNKKTVDKANNIWNLLEKMIHLIKIDMSCFIDVMSVEKEKEEGRFKTLTLAKLISLMLLKYRFVHYSMITDMSEKYNQTDIGEYCTTELKLKKDRVRWGRKNEEKKHTVYSKGNILHKELRDTYADYLDYKYGLTPENVDGKEFLNTIDKLINTDNN